MESGGDLSRMPRTSRAWIVSRAGRRMHAAAYDAHMTSRNSQRTCPNSPNKRMWLRCEGLFFQKRFLFKGSPSGAIGMSDLQETMDGLLLQGWYTVGGDCSARPQKLFQLSWRSYPAAPIFIQLAAAIHSSTSIKMLVVKNVIAPISKLFWADDRAIN